MILSSRKLRMERVLKGCLLFLIVFLPSVWWMYSKCVGSSLQKDEWDDWTRIEDDIRTKIEDQKRTKIVTVSNYIGENKTYPKDIKDVFTSTRKKRKDAMRQNSDNDQKYVKKPKEMTQNNKIEENKRINIEKISNYIEEHDTYPIDIKHIPASIQRKHKKDMPESYDDHKYLEEFKEKLQGNETSRVIKFEEDFLRLFLIANDYKIDRAYWKLQNFLNLRIDHNYFFHNMTFDFTRNPAYRFVTVLPHLRKDGSATIIFELAKWDPDIVPLEHLKIIMFIIYIQVLRNPVVQISGINAIYDFADAGFRYVKYGTPQNLYLLHHASFEAMPIKYRGYHLVNINIIGNMMLTIIRPFIPKFIEHIFHTHSSVEELHDFFPTSMLPIQYGGSLKDYYPADWIRNANRQHGHFPAGGQKNTF